MPSPLILSDTTTRILSLLIAERMMGWIARYPTHDTAKLDGYLSGDFSPTTKLSDAWEVVEFVHRMPCFEAFKRRIAQVDFFRLTEQEACIAICEAALECAA